MTKKTSFLLVLLCLISSLFTQKLIAQESINLYWLEETINSSMQENDISAVALGIIKEGKIWHQGGYGTLSKTNLKPVDKTTLFQIASISKTFTGIITNHLIEEGILDLDEKINVYLHKILEEDTKSRFSDIKLLHVANHSAGIPNFGCSVYGKWRTFFNWQAGYSRENLIQDMNAWHLDFAAGSENSYSNSGYALLGLICEEASGMEYSQLLEKYITLPLGMKNTMVKVSKDQQLNLASAYLPFYPGTEKNVSDFGMTTPASGIISCAEDLTKLLFKQYQSYVKFQENKQRNAFVTTDQFEQSNHYMLGLEKEINEYGNVYGHYGDSKGYILKYAFSADKRTGIILMASQGGEWFSDLSNTLYRKLNDLESENSLAYSLRKKMNTNGVEKAIAWYEKNKMYENYSKNPNEYKNIAYTFIESQENQKALAIMKIMRLEFTETNDLWDENSINYVAKQLIDYNMLDDAKSFLEINLLVFPESVGAFRQLGRIALKNDNQAQAEFYFEKSAKLSTEVDFFVLNILEPKEYIPTKIPTDTMQLFEYRGDLEKQDAFIFVQGGPMPFHWIKDGNPLVQMPNHENILRIYPFQSQIMNHTILTAKSGMTDKQSDFEHHQSVEMLDRTIKYFKNKGKNVYLLVHSYGGMITLEYLNTKENMADKIVLMGMNFDMDLRNYREREPGTTVRWANNEPIDKKFFMNLPDKYKQQSLQVYDNVERLCTVHGKRRYTELLKNKDLSNIIFVSANNDESIGPISEHEKVFLKEKNIKFIETYGDHHSMMTPLFMINLFEHLTLGNQMKKSAAIQVLSDFDKQGINQVVNNYQDYADNMLFHEMTESEWNNVGYDLMNLHKMEEAIAIFTMNTKWYPNSWNAYDSLGEAHLTAKNNDEALENYRKSVKLNPMNSYGIEVIENLTKE